MKNTDRYPKEVIESGERIAFPAGNRRENSRRKISYRIYCIATIVAERGANYENGEAEQNSFGAMRNLHVLWVRDGQHNNDE